MIPREIIRRMASTEGLPYDRQVVIDLAIKDVDTGADLVYWYPDVVFTLEVDSGLVHMYSLGDKPSALLAAARHFFRDVWATGRDRIFAPIINPRIERCALRFGWVRVGAVETGHSIYMLERKPQ